MLIKQKILFTKEECDLIKNLNTNDYKNWNMDDRNYNSYIITYNKNIDWIFNKLTIFFENEINAKIRKNKNEIHLHKFIKGSWFDRHNDVRDNRIYAVGVLLNDNFKEGDFKLYNPDEIVLDKITGNTYILWFLQKEHIKFNYNSLI